MENLGFIFGDVIILIISVIISLTDVVKCVWQMLNFLSILFNNDELLSSSFCCNFVQDISLTFWLLISSILRNLSVDVSTVDEILVELLVVMVSLSEEESFPFLDSDKGKSLREDRSKETWKLCFWEPVGG